MGSLSWCQVDNQNTSDGDDDEYGNDDEPREDIEELSKEALVHVARHLVKNQPVAQGAVLHIVADLLERWWLQCYRQFVSASAAVSIVFCLEKIQIQTNKKALWLNVDEDLVLCPVYRFVAFHLDEMQVQN